MSMKACTLLPMLSLVVLGSGAALAQDAVKTDPAHYKVVFDNPSVRVLKISYAAGEKSQMHQHPDSIVIPLSASKVQFTLPDGTSEVNELANEGARYSPAGTHNPANVGTTPVDALLVEFKSPKPGTAAVPTARPGMTMKVVAEGPYGMAYRTTADPTFAEPAGSKHDYDQIVIALGPAQVSLAIDGKPAKTNWTRGDAQFIGRGVAHESKNASGKPVEFIIVAIK
jgi:quercetin dioxygenase-like cupin family protein